MVKYLPENWVDPISGLTAWFSTTDELLGTQTIGDENDSTKEWSIKFDDISHDMFLFGTGDQSKWITVERSELIEKDYTNK